MIRVFGIVFLVGLLTWMSGGGCRASDEVRAEAMCRKAESLEEKSPRAALELKRQTYEEMPTAGTAAARACVRPVKKRMGRVRMLVSEDEEGKQEAIDGCAWAADAVEVFSSSVNPPFRRRWAKRLMERCATVVGRAWTRDPDNRDLMALSARLQKLSE